jgi:PIN domain nuclease of toxin-antitoxin system
MKLLIDTHLLLWAAAEPRRLSRPAKALLQDAANTLMFSAASLWEIAIKRALDRDDLRVDVRSLWRGLIDNGYVELPIESGHALGIDVLPPIHRDPFDRMLVSQAMAEGLVLVTSDTMIAKYPADVRLV